MKMLVSPELKQLVNQHAPNECFANKCLLFCSELLVKSAENKEQQLDEHEFFPLMKKIGEELYTRRAYYQIKSFLELIGAIEIDHGYLSTAAANRLKAEKKCQLEPHY